MNQTIESGTLTVMPKSSLGARRCRIVFRGESDILASAFPDMERDLDEGNTALVGEIVDQAHLQGLIVRAQSLGFELVSLNTVEADRPRDG